MNDKTTNKKHRTKKIIKLIIYIILLGLLAFIGVKSCNITLKALEPTATSWEDLNYKDIICNVNGNLSGDLDPDEYYYLNNGNNTSGPAQAPAFQIYDTYNGLAYDEIRIRQTSIYLRGYLYDSQDNYSDYYDRQIWANDFIGENITPDIIRFENISSDTPSNISGANVYYPNALNPFSAFLNIINVNFSYTYDNETFITNIYMDNAGGDVIQLYLLGGPDAFIGVKVYKYTSWNDSETNSIYYFDDILGYSVIDLNNLENNLNNYIEISTYYNNNSNDFDMSINVRYGNIENYITFSFYYEPDGDPAIYTFYEIYNYIQMTEYYKNAIENNAYIDGYSDGNTSGREVGYNIGYQEGYEDGASGEINTSWILSLMNTATSILNIEILPNIKLIYLVGAFIILAFVKFVIGWLR